MESNLQLVSVIMSAKNAETTISKAIESILSQTYENIELLVVDDFSSDDTYNKCKKYAQNNEKVKLYKNTETLGLTRSLNFLISKSNGDVIARQDADDYSHQDRIKIQIQSLFKNKVSAVCTRSLNINKNKKIPGISYFFPTWLKMKYKNPYIHGTLMIKKNVLEEVNYYDEDFFYAQDYKLFLDLIRNGYKIKNLNKVLYFLNTENNISSKFKMEQEYFFQCAKNRVSP